MRCAHLLQKRLRQREDHHSGDAQHDDLSERIEAPEVHEDHVDDVCATAALVAVVQVILGNRRLDKVAQHQMVAQPRGEKYADDGH